MNVICFGDSNTYGYDPRSYLDDRYPKTDRWVDILAKKTGWTIHNEGENGRRVPQYGITLPNRIDLLMIMLGTNDLLQGEHAIAVARRMEAFIKQLDIAKNKILLISPPYFRLGAWVSEQSLIDESILLSSCFSDCAQRCGVRYVNAGDWNIPLCFDGVHFTEEGHRRFADKLYDFLNIGSAC